MERAFNMRYWIIEAPTRDSQEHHFDIKATNKDFEVAASFSVDTPPSSEDSDPTIHICPDYKSYRKIMDTLDESKVYVLTSYHVPPKTTDIPKFLQRETVGPSEVKTHAGKTDKPNSSGFEALTALSLD